MTQPEALAILVVDADEPAREKLGEALVQGGSTVFLAANSSVALEIMRTKAPDLVLADLRLVGTTGIALLGRVRSLRPETWRILMATSHDWEAVSASLREGIVHRYFPRADPAQIAAALSSYPRPPSRLGPEEPYLRILLVQDSLGQRRLIAALLAPLGTVTAVEDGVAALREASSDPPEVVITGLDLDGISGLDLSRILRNELRCTAPIIVWEDRGKLSDPAAAGVHGEATRVLERTVDGVERLLQEIRMLTRRPPPPRRRR